MKVEPRNGHPEYHDHVKFLTIFDGFVAILPITGDVVERNLLNDEFVDVRWTASISTVKVVPVGVFLIRVGGILF